MDLWLAATAALLASLAACRGVIAARIWDAPDAQRKAHRVPTPSSGGLGIIIGSAAGLMVAAAGPWRGWAAPLAVDALDRMILVWVAAAAAGALGAADDLKPLGPRVKMLALGALALAAAGFAARAEAIAFAGPIILPLGPVLGVVGSALFVFTCMNAVNFIDGANGVAGGSAGVALMGFGVIGLALGAPHAAALAFVAAAATAGFLVWNAPAGKLFAGDAGSLFLGALTAGVGLLLVQDAGVSPLVIAIGLFPILFDVLETLVWRAGKRRNLHSAHRDHLYQIGIRAQISHRSVAAIYAAIAAHCALLAIVCALTGRIDPQAVTDAVGSRAPWAAAAAWVASAAAPIVLLVLSMVAWKVARRLRAFAAARGLDQP